MIPTGVNLIWTTIHYVAVNVQGQSDAKHEPQQCGQFTIPNLISYTHTYKQI